MSEPGDLALPGGAAELHEAVPVVAHREDLSVRVADHRLLVNPDLDKNVKRLKKLGWIGINHRIGIRMCPH
jgi:hypothetical protein